MQIRRLDNDQITWMRPAAFNNTEYTSQPIRGILPGPGAVTLTASVSSAHGLPTGVVTFKDG